MSASQTTCPVFFEETNSDVTLIESWYHYSQN